MQITITKDELFSIVKEAVKIALHEEKISLYLESVPPVSQEEMDEIERIHGAPSKDRDVSSREVIDL